MGKLKKIVAAKLRNAVGTPEIEQNIADVKQLTEEFRAELREVKSDVATSDGKIDVLQRETGAARADITQAHEKIDALQRESGEVHIDIARAQAKIDDLQRETGAARADITQAHEKIDALQRESGEIHVDLTHAHEKIDALRQETGDFRSDLTHAHEKIDELSVETGSVRADLTQAHEKIDALQRESGEIHGDLTHAHEKIDVLRREIGATRADLTQAHEKIDALQRESGEIHGDLTHAHEKIDELRAETGGVRKDLTQAHEKIDALQRETGEIHVDLTHAHEKIDTLNAEMAESARNIAALRGDFAAALNAMKAEIVRNQILNRWKTVDALDEVIFPPDREVVCRICGHSAPKKSYETRVSHCIFNGGKLVRFVCPECGCVFGPLKMFALTPDELAAEYMQHYSYYQEGDSHESELLAFAEVDRGKGGKVYLNYGAGDWSKTSELLRGRGYAVYDYEPFATQGIAREFLITSPEKLRELKFDGIFSNDLIEHLSYPVRELEFIKSLLRDEKSRMAHATGCFDYAYEYTRFHYFFFTGRSLAVTAEKLGMQLRVVPKASPTNTHFKVGIFSFPKTGKR